MTPKERVQKLEERIEAGVTGYPYLRYKGIDGLVEQEIVAAIAAEREACAELARERARTYHDQLEGMDGDNFTKLEFAYQACEIIAAAIRSRKK